MINKISLNSVFYHVRFEKRAFAIMQIVSFLFFFPIIYGASYYADDVSRVVSGSYGWDILGRYLATYVAKIYSFGGKNIIDPMPMGHILNISLIGISAYIIHIKLYGKYKLTSILIPSLFIINPFLVDNLLYRFDSTGMILSLFFVVLSFVIRQSTPLITLKIISLIISLNFYQTFSNIYIGLIAIEILLIVNKYNSLRKVVNFTLINLTIFISANIIYFFEIKLIGVSGRGDTLPINAELPYLVYENLIHSFYPFINFWSFFDGFILIIIPFIIISIAKLTLNLKLKHIATIIFSCVLIFFSSIGLMSLLKSQFIQTRGLSYFPIILMASCVIIWLGIKSMRFIVIIPVIACFIFVSRVGNMQAIQNNFEGPILFSVTKDIYKQELLGVKTFYSRGSIPLSRYIYNIRKSTPFNGFMSRNDWITTGRLHEYGNKSVKFEWSSQVNSNKFNPLKEGMIVSVDDNPYYKIYTDGNEGWIIWGDYIVK